MLQKVNIAGYFSYFNKVVVVGVLNLLSFEREVWVEHEEKETKGSALQTQLKKRIWYQLMGSKHIKRDIHVKLFQKICELLLKVCALSK